MPLEICNWMLTRIIYIYPSWGRIKKVFENRVAEQKSLRRSPDLDQVKELYALSSCPFPFSRRHNSFCF